MKNTSAGADVYKHGNRASVPVPMGRLASVFQMEEFATAVCFSMAIEAGRAKINIAICLDSQAAIRAIMALWKTLWLAQECQVLMRLHGQVKVV